MTFPRNVWIHFVFKISEVFWISLQSQVLPWNKRIWTLSQISNSFQKDSNDFDMDMILTFFLNYERFPDIFQLLTLFQYFNLPFVLYWYGYVHDLTSPVFPCLRLSGTMSLIWRDDTLDFKVPSCIIRVVIEDRLLFLQMPLLT